METSLVTGGAGFIGSHVCDELLKKGCRVVALDDLSGGFAGNVPPGVEFVNGSIGDAALVNRLFGKFRFDYVFHLAAYAAEGLSHFIKVFNYQNNLVGSINLINASVNAGCVKCFVFTSSIAVYGRNQVPMMESLVPDPEDPYGISKYAVELDLRESRRLFDLNYVIFRPHNVYGERQNIGDPYRNVIGIFMNQILQGKPMTIFGDGKQTRAFSYIADIVPRMVECVGRREVCGETFNIGADVPYSILELANGVAAAMGVEPRIEFLPARNEVTDAFCSHDKLNAFFGKSPGTDLQDGLKRMAAWARKAGSRQGSKFANIEVRRNMPEAWALLDKQS